MRRKKMKRQLALLVISALVAGMLPEGGTVAGRETSAVSPGEMAREGNGLNNPRTDSDGVTTWDCVYFGNYWQEDTNRDGQVDENDAKTPIKWRVLSADGDDVFLLADKNIDVQKYHTESQEDVTWETCTMRSWLNGYGAGENKRGEDYSGSGFINDAFLPAEQSAIQVTNVVNKANSVYGTDGGNSTSDQVYLLSLDEIMNPAYGFISEEKPSETRKAVNTAYVAAGGGLKTEDRNSAGSSDSWWLRSPGDTARRASYVSGEGNVGRYAISPNMSSDGVRPALHLKLSPDSVCSYAGTINSEGEEADTPTPIPVFTAVPTAVPTATPFQRKPVNPQTDSDGVTTWDCVYFGNYWQEDTNGDGEADKSDEKTPIKWRVLSVDGDDVFLMADKAIDVQRYNDTPADVTWETCTMRSWLNGYGAEKNIEGTDYRASNFLTNAFSAEEQSAIRVTNVVNGYDSGHGTDNGNDTEDQVYLLSLGEVVNSSYGFVAGNDKTRIAVNTAYAAGGGELQTDLRDGAGSPKRWWLRSSGDSSKLAAAQVNFTGSVSGGVSNIVHDDTVTVRPVLHMNLSSGFVWSYAGTVNSEGNEVANPTPVPVPTLVPSEVPAPGRMNPRIGADGVTTWDCVYFGNYWQEDTNRDGTADKNDAKTPIRWRVLSVNGDDAFLMADKSLDVQRYNETYTDVSWETSTMRSWLNGYSKWQNAQERDYTGDGFINQAFSEDEQLAINKTDVVNNNDFQMSSGGNDTKDNVYLLSLDEVMNPAYGFTSDDNDTRTRKIEKTAYAADGGEVGVSNAPRWWLRSPGDHNRDAAYVDGENGHVYKFGESVNSCSATVRPVLHLDLSSDSVWSYAGTVNSEGENFDIPPTPEPTAPPVYSEVVNPRIDENKVATWDCVYFGNYWQEDTDGNGKADKNDEKTPIRWRVLSVEGDDAFLMADKNLDVQRYNDTLSDVTWETCTMRSWLNGYDKQQNAQGTDYSGSGFINEAFSADEQAALRIIKAANPDHPDYGTEGGNDTSDKVYLLSINDMMNAEYGFVSMNTTTQTKVAVNTAYVADGGEIHKDGMAGAGSSAKWWLRSPGKTSSVAANVAAGGYVYQAGDDVSSDFCAVRPVLHLDLSAHSLWTYAGTINSKGENTGIATPTPVPAPTPVQTPTPVPTLIPTPTSTEKPEETPTVKPGETPTPTLIPTLEPAPTASADVPTVKPGETPTPVPVPTPTLEPAPTSSAAVPTVKPGETPTPTLEPAPIASADVPTVKPGETPTLEPAPTSSAAVPTAKPEEIPTPVPVPTPTLEPAPTSSAAVPTVKPEGTVAPTEKPGETVTPKPEETPTAKPGETPTEKPEETPTAKPGETPTPTAEPEETPTVKPGEMPTEKPEETPTGKPGETATPKPEETPTAKPGETPTEKPEETPTVKPGETATPKPDTGVLVPPASLSPVMPSAVQPTVSSDTRVQIVDSLRVKQRNKKVTVSWKKVPGAAGYQVCYSTSKKWKGKKQKLARKTKLTVKKLKKKKTYYFRVRAYRMEGKKKVYGAWSKVKKIKITK